MRIGVVTTSYPRWPDDPAGSFVAGHVDWLVRAGHRVDVVCAAAGERPDLAKPAAHTPWQPGVRIHAVAAPAGLFYAGGAPEALAARPAALAGAARFSAILSARLARLARSWDLAFAHWLVPAAAALAMAAPPGLPILAIAHSGDVHLARRLGLAMPLAAALAMRRMRLAFVSQHVRDQLVGAVRLRPLARRLLRASILTPMGIDVARFRAAQRATAAARQGLAGSKPAHTILFLGRLVPVKGASVLLDAVARLPARCGPVRVIVAGHGPERAALEAQATAARARCQAALTVDFAGEVRGTSRDRLLASADLLVLPSVPVEARRTEGLPVTALEAMAAGIPVIASQTGGLAELPAEIATLVPAGNAAALALALAQHLGDPDQRARQARAAGRWVEQHDWAEVGARLWAHAVGPEMTGPAPGWTRTHGDNL